MKKQLEPRFIYILKYQDKLKLLDDFLSGKNASKDSDSLLAKIRVAWRNRLPDLEAASLFQVQDRSRVSPYEKGGKYRYECSDTECDIWANLFDYDDHNKWRFKFAIDSAFLGLDDISLTFKGLQDNSAWDKFMEQVVGRPNTASPEKKVEPNLRKKTAFVIGAILTVCVVALAIWNFYLRSDPLSTKLPDKPSIAVLPFLNLNEDPKYEYFCDGLTDDIITDLSKISGLMVVSRNSTFFYKGKKIKIPVVAKELGVNYVLEGSIRKADNEIRINAQLINALTDHHIWADRLDGKNENIFDLQDKITERIVSALTVQLSASEQKLITDKGTNNIIAYDTFLKGMSHMRKFTPKDYVKAIEYFEKAIKLDPNYSEAYANLAYIYLSALDGGKSFWDEMGKNFSNARLLARHYVENAMKHPTSRSYQVMATMELYKRNFKEAIDNAENAVSIAPNDADALETLGRIMIWAGKPEEGIKYCQKSIMLDPLYKTTDKIGHAYFIMGNYEQAVKYIEKAIKDYPEKKSIRATLASSYAFLGNDVKAKKAFKEFNT
ncbi:MAG: tetratricopeptide repeat protein [Desulfobacteraceae bacterium]|nr:tetratricopeptide repeat protein [Desulfobacteraceae bacterium]